VYLAAHSDPCHERPNAATEQENSKRNPNIHEQDFSMAWALLMLKA